MDKKLTLRYNTPKGGIFMRILLCDDDPGVLQQMEHLLSKFFQQIGAKPPEIALYIDGRN